MKNSYKYPLSLLLMIIIPSAIYCGGFRNDNAKISVDEGAYLVVTGNYISNDGSVSLKGDLSISGDLENNNASEDILDSTSTGTVILNGTRDQNISGSSPKTVLQNLTIEGGSSKILSNDLILDNSLNLSSGYMSLVDNDLFLNTTTVVNGTPSNSAMIVTGGTGSVKKVFLEAGSFIFPVGADSLNYTPATLEFTSGTFTNGWVGVNVTAEKHPENESVSDHITRYWSINQSGITDFNCNTTFKYSDADIVGSENGIYSVQLIDSVWTLFANADSLNNTISAITDRLSDFTGYQGYKISYNANGATSGEAPEDQIKLYNIGLQLQANSGSLDRTGYIYQGWNTASNGSGTEYPVGSILGVNANVILYADWEIILAAPANIAIVQNGSNLEISWDAVPGATGYDIYSSTDPYGTFTLDVTGTLIGETWTAPNTGTKMFYYVKAVAEDKMITKISR